MDETLFESAIFAEKLKEDKRKLAQIYFLERVCLQISILTYFYNCFLQSDLAKL